MKVELKRVFNPKLTTLIQVNMKSSSYIEDMEYLKSQGFKPEFGLYGTDDLMFVKVDSFGYWKLLYNSWKWNRQSKKVNKEYELLHNSQKQEIIEINSYKEMKELLFTLNNQFYFKTKIKTTLSVLKQMSLNEWKQINYCITSVKI